MTLAALIRGTRISESVGIATATVATVATEKGRKAATVARVATVAVANPTSPESFDREAFEEPLREAKPDRFTEAEPDTPPIAARRLLLAAEEAGLGLAVDGGNLTVTGPPELKWLAQELFRAEPAIVEILQARAAGVVVLLSRREQGELDPDTVRALREREEQGWAIPCRICRGALFWHRKGGPLVCCTCHPPADEGIVYRRVKFEYVN